jgi:hypothetical protein
LSLCPVRALTLKVLLGDGLGRETDEEQAADLEKVINNTLHGEYSDLTRVVAFNTADEWSSDVSEDVAREFLKRVSTWGLALPASTRSFCEFHVGLRETALAERAVI